MTSPALAEIDADAYLGVAITNNSQVQLQSSGGSVPVSFDSSLTGGLRGTYWFEGRLDWLGLAADWSYLKPKESRSGNSFEIQMFPLSPLLMVRIPLFRSEKFSTGRFAPYAAVGPGIFISRLQGNGVGSITDVPIGLDYRFGMSVMFTQRIGLFSEYRYSSATFKFKVGSDRLKTRLEINQALVGVKARF